MRCDDGAMSADERDASAINGIFTVGMILQSQVRQVENGEAARHVTGAIELLDEAIREIRLAAFARQRRRRA